MRRLVMSLCVWWAAACGTYQPSNTYPLAFGMTPDEASAALGAPLTYHSGRRGNEIYLAQFGADVPGFYPVDAGLALQFRRGRLTGWKRDLHLNRPWPL